jgi:beta-galactosidase
VKRWTHWNIKEACLCGASRIIKITVPDSNIIFLTMKKTLLFTICLFLGLSVFCQEKEESQPSKVRERLLIDNGWRFALGDACDAEKDFGHGTGYFSYFTKTGYGDGPAAADFDDRAWRIINLPHDWIAELPFDSRAGHSHGYKAAGRNFPGNSVGWYRKRFYIPESDLGRRIVIEFDGVHRNSTLWINGFYIGQEHSGYSTFHYDITDYLNYGDENVIAVRVDVTMEEGWFYEGAGIYRHVWLIKTLPLHLMQHGTFVTSGTGEGQATVTAQASVINETGEQADFDVMQVIKDKAGKQVASCELKGLCLKPSEKKEYRCFMEVGNPRLWSPESPYLYRLFTTVSSNNEIKDEYETAFGIRSVRFDADSGFFLNGRHVQLRGTNNHQDHAGVGTAIPDALQEFRIARLKSMGSNAYRCSHNPPTPELLDACDRLGMLVLDENRLMGVSPEHFMQLKRMILRDRNHPCIIAWSIGNEEWAIEGNIKGARIASTMQRYVQRLDSTRRITAAVSGGRIEGISTIIDVMGYNYLEMGDIDEHHIKYPGQPMMLTEERTTRGTRGIYEEDPAKAYMAPSYLYSAERDIENGIHFCEERPFMAGLFFWTGFDYRGEANPYGWPQVIAQSGILDLCGFPKDAYYYIKSWWTDEPVIHIATYWNWKGKAKQNIDVRVYSNCDEVELFLNGRSLGRQNMPPLSHLDWSVPFKPGTLLARGYNGEAEVISCTVETAGSPAALRLVPDRTLIRADGRDVSVVTVQVEDKKGRIMPYADDEILFDIKGPGKIIGVGNGNPSSHEADQFTDFIKIEKIGGLKMFFTPAREEFPEVSFDFNDSLWSDFVQTEKVNSPMTDTLIVVRGSFQLPAITDDTRVTLFNKSICNTPSIYINGHLVAKDLNADSISMGFMLDHNILREGRNVYAVTGSPFIKTNQWEILNTNPGTIQVYITAAPWKRKVFNGLAQVIVQSDGKSGEITLTARSGSLVPAEAKIEATHQVSK